MESNYDTQELDHWYEEKCQRKKRKTKTALEEHKKHFMMKGNDGIERAGMNMGCTKIYHSSRTFLEE